MQNCPMRLPCSPYFCSLTFTIHAISVSTAIGIIDTVLLLDCVFFFRIFIMERCFHSIPNLFCFSVVYRNRNIGLGSLLNTTTRNFFSGRRIKAYNSSHYKSVILVSINNDESFIFINSRNLCRYGIDVERRYPYRHNCQYSEEYFDCFHAVTLSVM